MSIKRKKKKTIVISILVEENEIRQLKFSHAFAESMKKYAKEIRAPNAIRMVINGRHRQQYQLRS